MKRATASRLAWIVAALAAACGETAEPRSAPLDRLYRPTGLAVHRTAGMAAGRLIVASSNADLLFDDDTGGSLLAMDPASDPAALTGAIHARSFAGEVVVADPATCPLLAEPVALFATRGSNVLYAARVGPNGELSCDGCDAPLAGSFSDPFAVAVACSEGRARAFVGYLGSFTGEGWVSEIDLLPLREGSAPSLVRSMAVGAGPVGGLAYDDRRDRLYVLGLATASPTPLRWVELGGCTVGAPADAGGCTVGQAFVPGITTSIELRSMALAHPSAAPGADPNVRRAYLTGRLYDAAAATTAGGRVDDLGGRLLVVDLVENARGEVDVRLAREPLAIGRGAQQVRVLPERPGRRDLVAALTIDEGVLTLYDDDTGELVVFGRDPVTGAPVDGGRDPLTGGPVLGDDPFGLAVDPEPVGTVARLYVGAYADNWVTPIDVPLDAPDAARFTGANGAALRITGRTP